MNKNKTVQPLSENTRKAIIITAIVVAAVIILSVALALILKPAALSPDDESSSSTGSSSLSVKNGDFAYTNSEDTTYPRSAQDWTRYGYQKASSASHGFESINDHSKAVMGVVDVKDNWDTVVEDLAAEGITGIENPDLHDKIEEGDDDNSNVYMIATKQATTASIMSERTSVTSMSSVKITIWLNTSQLAKDSEAVIMIQGSTISALEKYWYAYDFHIGQQDGWQKYEFHIFNRDSSIKYIRVNIGIGNVYSGEKGFELADDKKDQPITGEGVLFIDDITYEKVNADEYRQVVDDPETTETYYKVIENEDIVDESKYLELKREGFEENDQNTTLDTFENANTYAQFAGYSPFTNRDDFYQDDAEGNHTERTDFVIYQLQHKGTAISSPIGLRLDATEKLGSEGIEVKSSLLLKDHHHLSFWVRVQQDNKAAYANVFVQKKAQDGSWEDLNSGSWTVITTSQDIKEDANNGWVKYDIYIKPTAQLEEISVLFILGKNANYTQDECDLGLVPKGSLYVTSPAYEKIAYNDYNSASSGSYVKKLDLVGSSSSTTITNGSFSTLDSTGRQPASWTAAFGGDNSLFNDGNGNYFKEDDERLASLIVGSGTYQNFETPVTKNGVVLDDAQKNVLQITTNGTSYGYFSSNITLSAKTAYVISAIFKSEAGTLPYIYLIDTNASAYTDNDDATAREQRIIASVTGSQNVDQTTARLLGYDYGEFDQTCGWTRYYMIVVTGDESVTARLALFNGSIDGTKTETGTVYYDKAEIRTLGTYSFVEATDDEKADNSDYETHYKVEWTSHPYLTATKENVDHYGKNFSELLEKKVSADDPDSALLLESWGFDAKAKTINTNGLNDMATRTLIPEKDDTTTDDTTEETTKEPNDVNLGFLFSVISSIVLVAALLVVLVVKLYKNKGKLTKMA